jgi:Anti-sigma-K factor rskA/Putative zinc-finger
MSRPGPDHERWADAVGSYLLDALPPEETEGFAAHLEACPVCRRDVEELAVAAEALPLSVPPVAPPAALRDRIMTVVESEAELLAATGRGADAPPRTRQRRGLLGGWFLRPGLALACAAVLLVAGGLAGALLGGGSPESRTVIAQTTAPGAEVRLEIRDDASTLVARGMPAPPGDRIYQVWIKRPGRDPEPTSVLWSTRGDGSAEVAVPGSLEGVEAVLVTDEPQGGSDAPTAAPVITAETT